MSLSWECQLLPQAKTVKNDRLTVKTNTLVITYKTTQLIFILLSTPFSLAVSQQHRSPGFGKKSFLASVGDLSRPEVQSFTRRLGR